MSAAMLWIRNAVMRISPAASSRHSSASYLVASRSQDFLGQLLLRGLFARLVQPFGYESLEEGDALYEFRKSRQEQEEESNRPHEARRPEDEAAGVGRDFVTLERHHEHGPRQVHDRDRHRH